MVNKFKKNFYLLITTITFTLSVIFAAVIFVSLEVVGEIDRTSVGFIYLGDKSDALYDSILNQEIATWQSDSLYTIYFQEYTYNLDLRYFTFDTQRSLTLLRKNVNNKAYFLIDETNKVLFEQDLRDQFTDNIIDELNIDNFISDITLDMQLLYVKKEYQLENYLNESLGQSVIDTKQLTNISTVDVNLISQNVVNILIPKNGRFSLLQSLSTKQLNNRQLSIIASGIQGVLDLSPMNGFSYEQNRELPVWAETGQNVRILQVNKYDFTFFNHLNYGMTLTISKINDNTLEFSLIGYPFVTEYESYSEELMVIPFPTEIYYDDQIMTDPNVEIIDSETETLYRLKVQDGIDGHVIFFYRIVTELGKDPVTYRIYDEQYLPTPEIYYEYTVVKEVI